MGQGDGSKSKTSGAGITLGVVLGVIIGVAMDNIALGIGIGHRAGYCSVWRCLKPSRIGLRQRESNSTRRFAKRSY